MKKLGGSPGNYEEWYWGGVEKEKDRRGRTKRTLSGRQVSPARGRVRWGRGRPPTPPREAAGGTRARPAPAKRRGADPDQGLSAAPPVAAAAAAKENRAPARPGRGRLLRTAGPPAIPATRAPRASRPRLPAPRPHRLRTRGVTAALTRANGGTGGGRAARANSGEVPVLAARGRVLGPTPREPRFSKLEKAGWPSATDKYASAW